MAQLPIEGGRLLANIMYFARTLRAAGLPIGPGKVLAAVEAVRTIGLEDRSDFYWTLHAVFVNRRDQQGNLDSTRPSTSSGATCASSWSA